MVRICTKSTKEVSEAEKDGLNQAWGTSMSISQLRGSWKAGKQCGVVTLRVFSTPSLNESMQQTALFLAGD